MNPSDIAREAAEALQDCYEYTKAGPNFDREAGAKIILTAAAKIVRESGAVEAMRAERESVAVNVHMAEANISYVGIEFVKDRRASLAKYDAALASLRALTDAAEGKQ